MATKTVGEGEQLMHDVLDLMVKRFPELPLEDPYRSPILEVLPALARSLGRPPMLLVSPNVVPIRQES